MPSHTTFEAVQVGGRKVDVAPLESINYARLVAKDPAEVEKLLEVCKTPGIFYLDLRDDSTQQWLVDLQDVYAISKQYFDQPHDVKMNYYTEKDDRG
jgi:isopenicillin N synthase-like dioxygenase